MCRRGPFVGHVNGLFSTTRALKCILTWYINTDQLCGAHQPRITMYTKVYAFPRDTVFSPIPPSAITRTRKKRTSVLLYMGVALCVRTTISNSKMNRIFRRYKRRTKYGLTCTRRVKSAGLQSRDNHKAPHVCRADGQTVWHEWS